MVRDEICFSCGVCTEEETLVNGPMTSKITHSLCLALVCSFVSAVSEQIADHNDGLKSTPGVDEAIQELVTRDNNITRNPVMKSETNVHNYRVISDVALSYRPSIYNLNKYDGVYTENKGVLDRHINIQNDNVNKSKYSHSVMLNFIKKNRVRRDEKANKCDSFIYEEGRKFLVHPHLGDNDNVNYSGNTYCTTVIKGPAGHVVQLSFIDIFHIEYHPECNYDFLEIRDGNRGYYDLLGKLCGDKFPSQIISTGPNVWLKFYSDETIEYEGFRIQIDFIPKDTSYSVPDSCETSLSGKYGKFSSRILNKHCETAVLNQDLDYLWSIQVPSGYKIYLNFTIYTVAQPNECDKNFVQVYGSILEYDEKKAHYCGSVANPVSTTSADATSKESEEDDGSTMYVRLYASKDTREKTLVNASFTAFRTLDLSKPNDTCDAESEFDCQDNTCIDIALRCDNYANCRLKADEEKDLCAHTTESLMQDGDIQMIVSIFCVILSGIILVCIFKCIMKLYKDHKIIKEQIASSREDRLEILGSQILMDAKRLQCDEEPRASLERDNQTNELMKQQKKFQKERPISIDSDFQDSYQDINEELWGPKVKDAYKKDDKNAERNKRTKGKEEKEIDIKIEQNERRRIKEDQEYLRRKEELNRRKESEERKQISEFRDASVGVPDTKQSGCQTRDSLFQTEPIRPSLDGKPKSRGLSMFREPGPSMAILPPQIKPSEITFEVIMPIPEQEKTPQKKVLDRRPMSAETTRSAPDVIVLAKPTAL